MGDERTMPRRGKPPGQPDLEAPEWAKAKPHHAIRFAHNEGVGREEEGKQSPSVTLEVLEDRVNRHAERIFAVEEQVSDLGLRIADHDAQLSAGEGITGKAKHWPVVTSQVIAGLVNALILLNPTTWQVLPDPWPVVIPLALQAVAAAIGGQFTHSKAEINERLQDGELVKPLSGPAVRRDDLRERSEKT